MQEGLHSVTFRGLLHCCGLCGGEKRSGGDWANGIPRNLFTAAVAEGKVVYVPTRAPEARVTVGGPVTLSDVGTDSATDANEIAAIPDLRVTVIVRELSGSRWNDEELDEV